MDIQRTTCLAHPSQSAPPLHAVFVDLDNTLVKGSALFHVGRGLAAVGLVDRSAILRLAGMHLLYRLTGEQPRMVRVARGRSLTVAAGLPVQELLEGAARVYDRVLAPRLWDGTLRLLTPHRAAGTPIWLATAAPVEIARLVADRLGLSGALGTHAEQRDGRWTGRLVGPVLHGPAKAAAVAELARREGWQLAHCAAYSDSMADLPLLASVGHPVVVNPDRSLRRLAASQGWENYDFRSRPGFGPHHAVHTA